MGFDTLSFIGQLCLFLHPIYVPQKIKKHNSYFVQIIADLMHLKPSFAFGLSTGSYAAENYLGLVDSDKTCIIM